MSQIVFCCTSIIDRDRRIQRCAKALEEAGFDCTLIGRPVNGVAQQFDATRYIRLARWKGVTFYAVYNLLLFIKLLFIRTDIIVAVDYDTLLAASLVSKIRNKALVFDAHEWFEEVPELIGQEQKKRLWKKIANYSLTNVKRAYTVNQSLADILSKQFHIDFEVVRNIGEAQSIDAMAPSSIEPLQIVYVGVFNEGRGLEQIIDCVSNMDDVALHLYGGGDIEQRLRALVLKNQQNNVVFHGYLAPSDFAQLSQHHVGINLLNNLSKSYYYSLANKYYDYIHAGLPSICMDFPEYRLLNNQIDVNYLIPNLQIDDVRNLILSIIKNPNTYHDKRKNCQIAKDVWTWQNEKNTLVQIYRSITADYLDT